MYRSALPAGRQVAVPACRRRAPCRSRPISRRFVLLSGQNFFPCMFLTDHRSPTTDHRPPTTDHRPPITDHRPPITDHRSPTTDHRPPTTDHRPPTTDHRPPTTDHRPPITDHRPPTTDHRSPTTDHRPPITDHRSPTTDHRWMLDAGCWDVICDLLSLSSHNFLKTVISGDFRAWLSPLPSTRVRTFHLSPYSCCLVAQGAKSGR
jgi:hypothetical protein